MARFRVPVKTEIPVYFFSEVEVEANSEKEAIDKVLAKKCTFEKYWQEAQIGYEFDPDHYPVEINDVEDIEVIEE